MILIAILILISNLVIIYLLYKGLKEETKVKIDNIVPHIFSSDRGGIKEWVPPQDETNVTSYNLTEEITKENG